MKLEIPSGKDSLTKVSRNAAWEYCVYVKGLNDYGIFQFTNNSMSKILDSLCQVLDSSYSSIPHARSFLMPGLDNRQLSYILSAKDKNKKNDMARPLRIEIPGGLYHVVSRGNGRLWLFTDDPSRSEFLRILGHYVVKYRIKVHVFVLMKTHYHLLLETGLPNLSQFMSQFLREYAMYYNRRHKRRGSVFKSRYGAFIIQQDRYYQPVTRYIYHNPVKAGLVSDPRAYRWSSLYYLVNRGSDKLATWYDRQLSLSLLGGITGLQALLGGDIEEPPVIYGQFIGDKTWADRLIESKRAKVNEEISGGLSMRRGSVRPAAIIGVIGRRYGISPLAIRQGQVREATLLAMHMLVRYTPLALRDVAKLFNMKMYALAQRLHRFRVKELKTNQRLGQTMRVIEKELGVRNV